MSDETMAALGRLVMAWTDHEFQRRALKTDRAKAMKIAIKLGAGVDYDDYDYYDAPGSINSHAGRLIDDGCNDDLQMQAVARVYDLDARYQEAANRARSLRASITKQCQRAGIVIARPCTAIAAQLDALDDSPEHDQ